MVLGMKAKNRKSPSVQVDYLIHIQEIKPWPPSQSLRTLRAVVIQWEHGDRSSGSTNQVIPSLGTGSGVGDGRIEFNESFRLSVTLLRELSAKGADGDTFQKNCIEFNLYEPRRDKTVKGQLLGTAVIDLADYGVVKETLSISAPIHCKRTYRNTSQPLLFLKIQSVDKSRVSSSSWDHLTREASVDKNGVDSVSALMNDEYAEEAETASYSEDDASSHSSLAVSSSAVGSNGGSPQNKENGLEGIKASVGKAGDACIPALEQQLAEADDKQLTTSNASLKGGSSRSSSVDLTSDLAWITKKIGARSVQSTSSPITNEVTEKEMSNIRSPTVFGEVPCDIGENVLDNGSIDTTSTIEQSGKANTCNPLNKEAFSDSKVNGNEILNSLNSLDSSIDEVVDDNAAVLSKGIYKADLPQNGFAGGDNCEIYQENGKQRKFTEGVGQCMEDKPMDTFSRDELRDQDFFENDVLSPSREHLEIKSRHQNADRNNKHVKSVRSPMDQNRSNNGSARGNQFISGDRQSVGQGFVSSERRDNKVHPKETRNSLSDSKIKQLEQRIKRLEAELRETAAIEVGLYSVVAEHGSSTNKVHAPARRLSRFYLHASKVNSQSQRGGAAQSAISGLILVAKACGNDVPRLTFWLSNSIVLRAIISESLVEQQLPLSGPVNGKNGIRNGNMKSSPLKWQSLSSNNIKSTLDQSSDDWEDPCTFTSALEKVESWIFSRIIESIWWQILTPHMQSGAVQRGIILDSNKMYQRTSSSGDEGTFSLELWKRAFKDACERICPVRAEGHECGCLPILSRLIMEQCVARLDVAMFNAILRDSIDDIPTDPVSDPISDANVLPVLVGKASFGAGAQLKNAIGNWSRWLTDLFGIDEDDGTLEDVNIAWESSDHENIPQDTSLKPFNLLNSLSDLMMLPKDMLLSRTIRKEVCPTFGPTLIRRVLNAFVPDEFCPDPIPKVVLEALNSEDSFDEEDSVNFPCSAAPIVYRPPSPASIAGMLGDAGNHYRLIRKGSLVLTKSYTSDEELDELASPLSSIFDSFQGSSSTEIIWASRGNGCQNATRYQLLRDVWKNSEK